MRPEPSRLPPAATAGCGALSLLTALTALACGGEPGQAARWAGTVDTLGSGHVVVSNPATGLWTAEEAWVVEEDLRVGSVTDDGPAMFGGIYGLEVDDYGRIWVLEGQSQEIRVFGADGRHVRTVGGKGSGPGEFAGLLHIALGPERRLWAIDPQNNRVSVIDTTGSFAEEHRMPGGFMIFPWPGGFDEGGRYWVPVPGTASDGSFRPRLVRFDAGFQPVDTLDQLTDPVEREGFELRSENGRMMAGIPFAPGFRTARSPRGTQWGLFTDEYRLIELSPAGDTLRTIRVAYDRLPVTDEDREQAIEGLAWFTSQGGHIDPSKIPDEKPAANGFSVDEAGRVWISRVSELPNGRVYDVLDADGRLLGSVTFPVALAGAPLIRGDRIYAVTNDELGVPWVVRFRFGPAGEASPD